MKGSITKGSTISFRPSLDTQSLLDKHIEDLEKATGGTKQNKSAVVDRLLFNQLIKNYK